MVLFYHNINLLSTYIFKNNILKYHYINNIEFFNYYSLNCMLIFFRKRQNFKAPGTKNKQVYFGVCLTRKI